MFKSVRACVLLIILLMNSVLNVSVNIKCVFHTFLPTLPTMGKLFAPCLILCEWSNVCSTDPSSATDAPIDPVLHGLPVPEGVGQTPAGHEEVLLRCQNQPRQGEDCWLINPVRHTRTVGVSYSAWFVYKVCLSVTTFSVTMGKKSCIHTVYN